MCGTSFQRVYQCGNETRLTSMELWRQHNKGTHVGIQRTSSSLADRGSSCVKLKRGRALPLRCLPLSAVMAWFRDGHAARIGDLNYLVVLAEQQAGKNQPACVRLPTQEQTGAEAGSARQTVVGRPKNNQKLNHPILNVKIFSIQEE